MLLGYTGWAVVSSGRALPRKGAVELAQIGQEQGLSLALAASREFFRGQGLKAACRVHGGGFAGTVQAYVPVEGLGDYRARMEGLFGPGALTVLRIRWAGAVEMGEGGLRYPR